MVSKVLWVRFFIVGDTVPMAAVSPSRGQSSTVKDLPGPQGCVKNSETLLRSIKHICVCVNL